MLTDSMELSQDLVPLPGSMMRPKLIYNPTPDKKDPPVLLQSPMTPRQDHAPDLLHLEAVLGAGQVGGTCRVPLLPEGRLKLGNMFELQVLEISPLKTSDAFLVACQTLARLRQLPADR